MVSCFPSHSAIIYVTTYCTLCARENAYLRYDYNKCHYKLHGYTGIPGLQTGKGGFVINLAGPKICRNYY